jgi:hypothetical protein
MSDASQLFGSTCPDLSPSPSAPCAHYVHGGFCTLGNHFRCIEYILRHEPPLSFSAIDTYTSCHRKFYWSYLVGLEPVEKSWPLQLGSAASHILGILHNKDIPDDRAKLQYEEYIELLIKDTTDPEDEEQAYGHPDIWRMRAMFDAYIAMDLHTLRGIPEYEFRWTDPEYPKVHGYIDLVQLVTHEDHFGWEFKWTGNPDSYGKFLIEDQICAYLIGDPAINRMTVRCFVPPEMRRKQATKKQTGESMLEFYRRMYDDILTRNFTKYFIDRTYWRSEFNLDNYKNKAARTAQEIMRYIDEAGIAPFYQNKKNCLNPFRCDFLSVCENDIERPWEMECYKKRGERKNAEGIR